MSITIEAKEGALFNVPLITAQTFGVVRNVLSVHDALPDGFVIYAHGVEGHIVKKVLDWVNFHKDVPSEGDRVNATEWDREFWSTNVIDIILMTEAATFFNIRELKKASSIAFINEIRGKSTEEIRRIFELYESLSNREE